MKQLLLSEPNLTDGDQARQSMLSDNDWRKLIQNPSSECILADDGENILGFAAAQLKDQQGQNKVCIHHLFVNIDYRRQGIGRQLLIEIEESFLTARLFAALLAKADQAPLAFYQALGYKARGIEDKNNNITAISMEKVIY